MDAASVRSGACVVYAWKLSTVARIDMDYADRIINNSWGQS